MQMTSFEIRQEYKLAKNPRQQIKILAELNGCLIRDIKDILAGKDIEKRHKSFCKVPDEEKMALYKQGLNDREMGDALGISAAAVCAWRIQNGLERNIIHKFDYGEISRLYSQGFSDREIADIVGCEISYVSSWRWRKGLSVNKKKGAPSARPAVSTAVPSGRIHSDQASIK